MTTIDEARRSIYNTARETTANLSRLLTQIPDAPRDEPFIREMQQAAMQGAMKGIADAVDEFGVAKDAQYQAGKRLFDQAFKEEIDEAHTHDPRDDWPDGAEQCTDCGGHGFTM
jgi:hypothetical protein